MMEEKYENPSSVSLRSTASPLGSQGGNVPHPSAARTPSPLGRQGGDCGRMVSAPTGGPETEIARVIQTVMDPVLRAMAQMIEQNVEALKDIAVQQKVVNERLDALEEQIRRHTPVTPTMVRYINKMGDGGRMVSAPTGGPETEIARVIQTVMDPVLRAMAQMIEQNVEALKDIAVQQKVVNERLDALEEQIRRHTPVTPTMVRYINKKIRETAIDRLTSREDKEIGFRPQEDRAAVNKLCRFIRADVLERYGVSSLNEIPKQEYSVVMAQAEMWNDRIAVKNVAEEARK